MREIDVFQGSKHYEKFLRSFYAVDTKSKKVKLDFKGNRISKAIFYHLWKVYHSEWEMRVGFKLMRKHTLSDYFRDLVACYLNLFLDDQFEIVLESGEKIVPDILIKKKGKSMFAIEIKTTLGWQRNIVKGGKEVEGRINDISKTFKIKRNNIIYILVDSSNVNKEFREVYWDYGKGEANKHPKVFPYSRIFPLFHITPDPYYWDECKEIDDKDKQIKKFKKETILEKAEKNIICKFEDIIMQIEIAGW